MVALETPPAAAVVRDRPRLATVRRGLRAGLVASVSAAVLLAAAAYVLAPTDASVTVAVQESSTPFPYVETAQPHDSLVSARILARPTRPKYREVIYGKVDASGVPVSRMSLKLTGADRDTRGQAATIPIKRAGIAYRTYVNLHPGRYRLAFTIRVGSKDRTVAVLRTLRDRKYYRIAAKVRPNGVVSFFPITSY